jgi:hypothetical protein
MKWILAIALSFACGGASAKVLTDRNLPDYDVGKECSDAPEAAAGGQAFVAHCMTSEDAARSAMFGLDIPGETLKLCAKEVEKHPPGRNDRDLNICIRQQSGRAEIKKLEAFVPHERDLCAEKSSRGDCIAQEKKWHRFLTANPTVLTLPGTGDCIENLQALNTLSWKKVAACAANPARES